MKIERLSTDKIRIFLTFDDLTERGIRKEDLWREVPNVHELFSEIMEQAHSELGFDASGPLAVEFFALPAQGMVVIVTKSRMNSGYANTPLDEGEDEDVYELEVSLEESDLISYAFNDFEDLLSVAKIINAKLVNGGILFNYKDKWILQLDPVDMEEKDSRYQALIAVLSEFGEPTSVTRSVLDEYGKVVISDDAVKVLCAYF